MSTSKQVTAETVVHSYIRAMSEGIDPADLPFADSVVNFYGHTGQEHVESGSVRAAYTAQMGRILPRILNDFAIKDIAIDVVSTDVAYVRLTISGRLPSGESVCAPQCTRFQLDNGRIVRIDGYIDQSLHHSLSLGTRALQRNGDAVFSDLTVTVSGS